MQQVFRASLRQQLTSSQSVLAQCLRSRTALYVSGDIRCNSSEALQQQETKGQQLLRYWQGLLGTSDDKHAEDVQAAKSAWKTENIKDLLHAAIRVRHGRVSGVLPEQLLSTFIQVYRCAMGPSDRLKLFHVLCNEFGVQETCFADRGEEAVLRSVQQLQEASQPLYNNLFIPFSNQPNGIKFLVDMRADVRAAIKQSPATAGPLRALERNLRQSLATWFSVGLLQLQPLSWDASPADLLEKVMVYEAVHPVQGWADLHQRLGPMRRVHAFMHPSMPQEPLVILHCALQRGAASSMNNILHPHQLQLVHPHTITDDEEPQSSEAHTAEEADTAVFYSISSTQKGLAGIDLGNFLIKQVAQRVLAEFPGVQTLITLSPIPGFRKWLQTQTEAEMKRLGQAEPQVEQYQAASLLRPTDLQQLQANSSSGAERFTLPEALQQLSALAQQQDSIEDQRNSLASLQDWKLILMRLCAHYLIDVRRRRLAFDPVANFHLRNGASVWRLNWGADLSHNGLRSSFGVMVNYKYVLEDVHKNNQAYLVDGVVPASQPVLDMAEANIKQRVQ